MKIYTSNYIICNINEKNYIDNFDNSNNCSIFAAENSTKYNLNNKVMDFGYDNETGSDINNQNDNGNGGTEGQTKTHLGDDGKQYDANGNLITDLNNQDGNNRNDDGNDNGNHGHDDNRNDGGNNGSEIELNPGETIEIGDDIYTVGENGDLLDKDGNVFKEAKDVKEFLKDYQDDSSDDDKNKNKNNNDGNDDNKINIENIKKALGYEIVDENDKDIEYDDSIEGIKTYVNDVIEQKTTEIQEATLNTLFEKYPFAEQMINYYIANGNSLEGWNVETDRSEITIDENNEKQQEDIIRTAWKEQKRTGDVENYIGYLKSNGLLLSSAKSELEGLQNADKARKEELAQQAAAAHKAQEEEMEKFWNSIETAINGRTLGKYKIPEQIKVNRGGKTLMVTPKDFYKYLSETDKNGDTAYARDCKAVSNEQQLNDSLLRAYIMFTGGDYSSLVDMAVKEDEVRKLRLKAKESKQVNRRLTLKGNGKDSGKDENFGY